MRQTKNHLCKGKAVKTQSQNSQQPNWTTNKSWTWLTFVNSKNVRGTCFRLGSWCQPVIWKINAASTTSSRAKNKMKMSKPFSSTWILLRQRCSPKLKSMNLSRQSTASLPNLGNLSKSRSMHGSNSQMRCWWMNAKSTASPSVTSTFTTFKPFSTTWSSLKRWRRSQRKRSQKTKWQWTSTTSSLGSKLRYTMLISKVSRSRKKCTVSLVKYLHASV